MVSKMTMRMAGRETRCFLVFGSPHVQWGWLRGVESVCGTSPSLGPLLLIREFNTSHTYALCLAVRATT